jgi:hypothetical protein
MNPLDAITSLECSVVIPDAAPSGNKSIGIIDLEKDKRRFPRIACKIEAAMQYHNEFPAQYRPHTWVRVLVRDISRRSMGFWHSEAMFPLERALIVFPTGIQRLFEVRRCRRLGASCFEVGGVFGELLNDPNQISELFKISRPSEARRGSQ